METGEPPRPPLRRASAVHAMALALSALASSGCEQVLGIDGHDARLGGAPGAAASDSGAVRVTPCVLPADGDATLRFGNLSASAARADVCLTRVGDASSIDGRPVIASSGATCPRGLGFKDVSAPFHVDAGTYAVALVVAGSGCSATPLATAEVTIASGGADGIYALGNGVSEPRIVVLNETGPSELSSQFRFLNGLQSGGAVDLGYAATVALPTAIQMPVFANVSFGAVGAVSEGSDGVSDPNGYVPISLFGGSIVLGVAPTGTGAAIMTDAPVLESRDSYTAFAIGRANDPTFPQELYVCNETENDGVLTRCANGGPTDLTIDVFDTSLWGPLAPLDALRTDPIVAAVAALPSDVACIVDTFPESVEQQIIAAAKARFPYAVHFTDTLTTPIDDPAMQDGGLPPSPTTAPCVGDGDDKLEPLLACVRDHCTTSLGSEDAGFEGDPAACISINCYSESAALVLSSDPQQLKCWICAILNIQSNSSMAKTRTECTTTPNPVYAFDGSSGVLLLSRYPVTNSEQWVMGATDWRVSVVRAPLTLPGPKSVDAYCTILTDPVGGQTNPYTGAYGGGSTSAADARGAENLLQTQKLTAWVKRKSAGIPAFVAGEFYAGPSGGANTAVLPSSYAALSGAFGLGAPPATIPGCTLCCDNPITSPPGSVLSDPSTLTTYPLLWNIPITDVMSASIALKANVVDAGASDAGEDGGTYMVPLSPYYDYRATLRIRP